MANFSTATPSAMVRVFQAYGCHYAMHLDMNALEHTYLALYTHAGGRLLVQHLVQGMAEVDRKGGGELAPRFLSLGLLLSRATEHNDPGQGSRRSVMSEPLRAQNPQQTEFRVRPPASASCIGNGQNVELWQVIRALAAAQAMRPDAKRRDNFSSPPQSHC
jgi:hypothetical protein